MVAKDSGAWRSWVFLSEGIVSDSCKQLLLCAYCGSLTLRKDNKQHAVAVTFHLGRPIFASAIGSHCVDGALSSGLHQESRVPSLLLHIFQQVLQELALTVGNLPLCSKLQVL